MCVKTRVMKDVSGAEEKERIPINNYITQAGKNEGDEMLMWS